MNDALPVLNLPETTLELVSVKGVLKVRCLVRKKSIILTPEEWVRQHFIFFLYKKLGYPLSLMKVEKQILVNNLKKRFDIVTYNASGEMKVLIECKAARIELDASVFDQAARYNLSLKVPYLVITNGMKHYCAEVSVESKSFSYLNNIPTYKEVKR